MDPLLERTRDLLRDTAGTLTAAELHRGLDGKWSPAQILEHLRLTFSATAVGSKRIVTRGSPAAGRARLSQRVAAFVVVTCGYFPPGREAPERVRPGASVDATTVLAEALASLEAADAALEEAARRFGTGVKLMDHPVLGPFSVRQWRTFHWVHSRHHARQIVERARG